MKAPVRLTVNGKNHESSIDTRMVLADFLREELDFTGTHVGCGTGSCGAFVMIVDAIAAAARAMRSSENRESGGRPQ